MMDLSKPLPDSVYVNGNGIFINTDFRYWLKFGEMLKNTGGNPTFQDIFFIFKHPEQKILKEDLPELFFELILFYTNKTEIPRNTGGSSDRLFDYLTDGEYIYASFLQQYNINLTKDKLHWHEFLALFRSISDDTIIGKIMGYRGYKKDNRSHEQVYQQLKYAWDLPIQYTDVEKKQLQEFNDYFN